MAISMLLLNTPTSITINPSPRRAPRRCNSTSIRSGTAGGGEDAAGGKSLMFDRRNVLLGLGWIYGATPVGGVARGEPLQPPDLRACHPANYPDGYGDRVPVQCCPPYDLTKALDIQPYVIPKGAPPRMRKAAQKLTKYEIDRLKTAVAEMKKLPKDHPWSFQQQAQVHCAYCNEGYTQKGYSVPIQVHFSWYFLPWHRWYIYFFEKILGKIIGDDTIALPFWNYDDEQGMTVPDMYKDRSSSLYNANRNLGHMNEKVILTYSYDIEDMPVPPTVVSDNLNLMATMFDEDSIGYPPLFMGDKLQAGELMNDALSENSMGRLEVMHNMVHSWVGKVEVPNLDMGNFYSAARDAIFYGHHSNVDRLWELYRAKRGYAVEFNDTNWLDGTFLFIDENQKIVSVKVCDSLNPQLLGYSYENVPIKYMTMPKGRTKPAPVGSPTEFGPSPRKLDGNIVVTVRRPKASRTAADKINEAELLVVDGIVLGTPDASAFNVFVSNSTQDKGEMAGIFARVRHSDSHGDGHKSSMKLKLGITQAVERIGADSDDTLVVTIVPRTGDVTIGGVHIELVPKQKIFV